MSSALHNPVSDDPRVRRGMLEDPSLSRQWVARRLQRALSLEYWGRPARSGLARCGGALRPLMKAHAAASAARARELDALIRDVGSEPYTSWGIGARIAAPIVAGVALASTRLAARLAGLLAEHTLAEYRALEAFVEDAPGVATNVRHRVAPMHEQATAELAAVRTIGAAGSVVERAAAAVESEPRRLRLEERSGAVVLLSGGLDSATVLAIARARGIDCYALTVDYGQRHHAELVAARRTALYLGASGHRVVEVDLRAFGGSALTSSMPVPHPDSAEDIGRSIPSTYVPARNTILLSLALAWAEVLEVNDIYIGANSRDYSGYPDCRREYLEAFETLANLATKASIEGTREFHIDAPILDLDKAQIIAKGMELGVDFSLTHSCYDPTPEGYACGICDACILRRQGFQQAGVDDPTVYAGDD